MNVNGDFGMTRSRFESKTYYNHSGRCSHYTMEVVAQDVTKRIMGEKNYLLLDYGVQIIANRI